MSLNLISTYFEGNSYLLGGYTGSEIFTSLYTKKPRGYETFLLVDNSENTLNRLKDYLSNFWIYYQSSQTLQKALEITA